MAEPRIDTDEQQQTMLIDLIKKLHLLRRIYPDLDAPPIEQFEAHLRRLRQ
jgi:hypothetical protein